MSKPTSKTKAGDLKKKTAGRTAAQLVTSVSSDYDLPVATILTEYLGTTRNFVGSFIGQDREGWRAPTFHMSGGVCERDEILSWAGFPKLPENPTSMRRFATGHLVEAVMEKAMAWKGVLVWKQGRVWRDWLLRAGRGHRYLPPDKYGGWDKLDLSGCLVSGTFDWILAWKRKSGDWGVWMIDCKTVDVRRFYKVDKAVDPQYATQVVSYGMTAEEQLEDQIRNKLERMGVVRAKDAPLFDGYRLVYASVGGPIMIAQVPVLRAQWEPRVWARWRNQRRNAIRYVDEGTLPPEMPAEGENLWKCDPQYCRFTMALNEDGKPVCPQARERWIAKIEILKSKGKDAGWAGRALRISELMKTESEESKREIAILSEIVPEAVDKPAEPPEPGEPPEPESGEGSDKPGIESPGDEVPEP